MPLYAQEVLSHFHSTFTINKWIYIEIDYIRIRPLGKKPALDPNPTCQICSPEGLLSRYFIIKTVFFSPDIFP